MPRKTDTKTYDETISEKGFRFTEQRRAVFDAVMVKRDHPTAVEVFMRVKGKVPTISLATVYNCLETLAECGLVRHVNHEREPSRYCANLTEHAHLFCTSCGSVTDLPLRVPWTVGEIWDVPPNAVITQREASFRGICPKCANSPQDGNLSTPKPTKKAKS